jgi:hypothetical protein
MWFGHGGCRGLQVMSPVLPVGTVIENASLLLPGSKVRKCALLSICFLGRVALTFFERCSSVVNSMIGLSFARLIRPCSVTRLGSGWARLRNLEAVRIPTRKRLIELATYCHNFVACVMG